MMRKLIHKRYMWDGSKWLLITTFTDLDTGAVYRDLREYIVEVVEPHEALHRLSMDTPIDKYKYMPLMQPDWRVFKGNRNDPDIFVKEPCYRLFEDEAHLERDALEREIQMYHTPGFQHRNIVDFHGCIVENGHVAGLVLARLSETLSTIAFSVWLKHVQMGAPAPTLISDDGIPYDHDSVMDDIRPAIEHLKKLGLIYLDLKLENIMWAWDTEKVKEGEVKQGRWCLIDFDDLYPAGKHFDVAPGTPGWKSDKGGVAEDLLEITLAKLSRYLTTGKMTGDHGEPESEPSPEMVEYRNIVRGIQEARQEARQRQKALHTSAKAKAL